MSKLSRRQLAIYATDQLLSGESAKKVAGRPCGSFKRI